MTWVQTVSGRKFDLVDPWASEVLVHDVAHALSVIPRFLGHTVGEPYSVAQHCVLVSQALPPGLKLWGLLHDAHEAYVGDVPSPVKQLIGDAWTELERRVQARVLEAFGLELPVPVEVAEVDLRMMETERQWLTAAAPEPWPHEAPGVKPLDVRVRPWCRKEAYRNFKESIERLACKA